MILKIFKIVTSLVLLGILVLLATKRELIYSVQDTFRKKAPVSTAPAINEQKNGETLLEPIQKVETVANVEPIQQPVAVSQNEIKPTIQPPKTAPKNIKVLKKSVYITMNEGVSDTDEQYQPIVSPCTTPMGFKIGTFDTHFGISKAHFISEVTAAQRLWSDQLGKELFFYDDAGPLTINLIYDERQARTEEINDLAMQIENSKKNADALQATYQEEKVNYEALGATLTQDSEAFQIKSKTYSDKVATYNAQGGAEKSEYDAMMTELANLKEEAASLDLRRKNLLVYMDSINAKVTRFNEFVGYINGLIVKSNALGTKKFTEGRFSPGNNTIDIFQYSDTIKLRRVITHEFGHVLGINHNDNIFSIMYSVNSATTTQLSSEDIAALRTVCPK